MKKVIINTKYLNNRGHNYLKTLFSFPDYYGKNLDALYDCLSDLDDCEVDFIYTDFANELSEKIITVFENVEKEYDNPVIHKF